MFELYILLVMMIIGALVAIEAKDLLSSVVALGVTGLALVMAFLILKAPDVAITQLIIELLALIILIRATLNRDLPFSTSGRWYINTFITIMFIFVFIIVGVVCFRDLPAFGQPFMRVAETYLKESITRTGATNVVSAVVLDFRSFDTLGEATVLFTAAIGVATIARRVGRKKPGEKDEDED